MTRVYGVWEHDFEHDLLIGLFWRREEAEARAAENPAGNLPGRWPDTRGNWIVEEHEVQRATGGVMLMPEWLAEHAAYAINESRERMVAEARELVEDFERQQTAEARTWTIRGASSEGFSDGTYWSGPEIPENEGVRVIEAAPLYALVDEQAEDEGLWSTGLDGEVTVAEAMLQAALRRLHTLIESGRPT